MYRIKPQKPKLRDFTYLSLDFSVRVRSFVWQRW